MDASLLAWLNQEDPPKPKPRKEPFYNDPMDPYTLPTSDNNYDNVTDVINRKPFAAVYPQSYTPIPNYFKRFGYAPFYQPGEGELRRGHLRHRQPFLLHRPEPEPGLRASARFRPCSRAPRRSST